MKKFLSGIVLVLLAQGLFATDGPGLNRQNQGGVRSIIPGTNVTVSPGDGKGDVTVNASGSGGGGDNLGTHVATQAVQMANFGVINSSGISIGTTTLAALAHIAAVQGFTNLMIIVTTGSSSLFELGSSSANFKIPLQVSGNAVVDVSNSSQTKTGAFRLGSAISFLANSKFVSVGFNNNTLGANGNRTNSIIASDTGLTSLLGLGFTDQTSGNVMIHSWGSSNRKLLFATGTDPGDGSLAIDTTGKVGVNHSTPTYGFQVGFTDVGFTQSVGNVGVILRITTGGTNLYEFGGTSATMNGQNFTILATSVNFAGSTFTFAGIKFAFPNALPGSNGLCLAGNTDGVLYFTACGSGGGGSALSIGGYAGNAFKVAASTINASGDIAVQTEGSSFTFRVDLSTLSNSTSTLLNIFNASTASITNFINSIASEAVSGGGGGVKSLYLTATLDSSLSNTYSLMFTTPSTGNETSFAASVAAADGLVSVSSHVTIVTGLGQSVNKIPAGFWQFTIFAKEDSIVGQTDLIIDVSTISRTGTNKFKIISSTISNINSTSFQIFDGEAIRTSDVFISTDDRILVQIYAKTTSALARTITVAYEGTTRASRIGTSIERNPTFVALDDTPSTYIGSAGKIPQVNSTETGLQFITIPDVSGTTTTRLNNLDASTATLTTRLNNLDTSTANITTQLGNLDSSTATLTTRLNNLDSSTAAITTRVNNLDTSTSAITTRLNNLDSSTSSITTALKSTGTALTNHTNAVVTSTQNIANSTGVVVNGTLISSFVVTGAGQSTSFNGGTVTITIPGGGTSPGDSLGTHKATTTLDMQSNPIVSVSSISVSSLTVTQASTTINGVPYKWPASQASGTKILSNDGAGNLSWATDQTGAGGGGGGAMTFQQGQGGTWIAQSSIAVLLPLQFDPLGSSSGTLTLPTTAQVTISTLTATVVKISSALFITSGGTGLSTTYHRKSFFIPAGYWGATKSSGTSLFSSSETVTNLVPFDQMMFVNRSTTYAYAPWMMPSDWDTTNSTLTFKFVGLASSGTVGNTSTMTLSCETFRYRDAIDTALGAGAGTSIDFSAANQVLISSESAPMTCAGTPTGDSFATFKLGRLGSDSLDAFLQLLGVRIYYNSKSWTE